MAIKLRIPGSSAGSGRTERKFLRVILLTFLALCLVFCGVFAWEYVKYDRIINERMSGRIFNTAAKIYARPLTIHPGEPFTIQDIASSLRRAGYEPDKADSPLGTYTVSGNSIQIHPGPESFQNRDGAIVRVSNGAVETIYATGANSGPLDGYELEPELVTALFEGEQRTKRQLVRYEDIPNVLVDAVIATEDRRFFEHSGINYWSLLGSLITDLSGGVMRRGGSTITMQVSRGFFLSPEKRIKRKLIEMLIATELEHKFTKKQIFELYANQVYMGQRGSYSINGFGEAARSYFGKDVKSVTLPEAAVLAGIIQSPNYWNPYKRPEKVVERRNTVLESMVETGAITREQADKAKAAPLKLANLNVEASDAPYFVDLVKDTLASRYSEQQLNENAYHIYTTIDPQLQRAAAEAIEIGMKQVDEQVRLQRTHKRRFGTGKNAIVETVVDTGPSPQVALVAIDPHTGEVVALVGGRSYGWSQLNHAVAKRPTGSVFKPFVYAAAMNTGVPAGGLPGILPEMPSTYFTPVTMVDDSPTTFAFGDQIYEPRNYKNEYHGMVPARYALQHSLNNATVKMAEMVGYDRVADLAHAAGITSVKPTPAMALGAYDATPLEMAGAYTIFANGGTRIEPVLIQSIRAANGDVVENFSTPQRQVLDPRVAFVMTNMLEGVINNGTGSIVRTRGFTAPAAGKTGTSHDAWFAGYTSNLLCIVWVGYDDYSDLKLAGGTTAAPIWAEFMKRALALPQYRSVHPFQQPAGVVDVALDKATNLLATGSCPDDYVAAFIAGTEPHETCDHTGGGGFFQRVFGMGRSQENSASGSQPGATQGPVPRPPQAGDAGQPGQPSSGQQPAKKGFWERFWGTFKGSKKDQPPQNDH